MSSESDKTSKHRSGSLGKSQIFLTAAAVLIIIFAIVIVAELQTPPPQKTFSKIITVGPIWPTKSWSCTSNSDFVVYGAVRGLQGSLLAVNISGIGTQSLYSFNTGQMGSFTIGAPAGHTMILTKTGTLTGFLTLQTTSDAKASCTQA